jgi:hypothetical protein
MQGFGRDFRRWPKALGFCVVTPLESLVWRLRRRGFDPLFTRQPACEAPWGTHGIVAVAKPEVLAPGWNGPRLGACLLLSAEEERWLRQFRAGRAARLDVLAKAVDSVLS